MNQEKQSAREWVPPKFERQPLKDALAGVGAADDGGSGYTS